MTSTVAVIQVEIAAAGEQFGAVDVYLALVRSKNSSLLGPIFGKYLGEFQPEFSLLVWRNSGRGIVKIHPATLLWQCMHICDNDLGCITTDRITSRIHLLARAVCRYQRCEVDAWLCIQPASPICVHIT